MKTLYDLYMSSPDKDAKRIGLAYKAFANGDYDNALHFLGNVQADTDADNAWFFELGRQIDMLRTKIFDTD